MMSVGNLAFKKNPCYHLLPLFFGLLAIFGSCDTQKDIPLASIDADEIERQLLEISSDAYEGRMPFTDGDKKTVEYLTSELKKMGLAPGNGTSFSQNVPMVEITGKPEGDMQFKSQNGEIDLDFKKDYVAYSERIQEKVAVVNSEVIFCGFGISAPEFDWNDFEGIDVKGKTIVVLVNDPGFGGEDDNFFKGNTMTYYGRWTYKYEEAARQGAAAVLIVHETTSAGYPWFVVEGGFTGPKLNLLPEDGGLEKAGLHGWITLDVAKNMFDQAGFDLGSEIRKARTRDFRPFSLGYTMSQTLTNTFKYDNSDNVIATIPGAKRPDEYILFSAHWDHLGIGKVVDGDSIYNGALDNASGVAAVLSIAKAIKNSPSLDRTTIFLFVTAEEQGLLGSQYYSENPIYPINKTVANLNIDALNPFGPMKFLTVTGFGQSELDEYAEEMAAKQGREVLPDQEPEKGYFFRSDHFNFAKVGIPALYAEGSFEHAELGKDYIKEKREQFISQKYHQPSDEYNTEEWDLRGLVQDAQLYLDVARKLANEQIFPKWKAGSEFKAIREKSLQ